LLSSWDHEPFPRVLTKTCDRGSISSTSTTNAGGLSRGRRRGESPAFLVALMSSNVLPFQQNSSSPSFVSSISVSPIDVALLLRPIPGHERMSMGPLTARPSIHTRPLSASHARTLRTLLARLEIDITSRDQDFASFPGASYSWFEIVFRRRVVARTVLEPRNVTLMRQVRKARLCLSHGDSTRTRLLKGCRLLVQSTRYGSGLRKGTRFV
jgi:hypothetical protein